MTDDSALGETPLVYAIGDIHGSLQKLRDLITLWERHADGRLATFVFLGDYVDRGPSRISRVRAPVLVVHGENDAIVPIALGKRLYTLIHAPKQFVRVAGAGHNDLGAKAIAAAKQFIAEK
jgi:pimeloyl-ACP methyl ester carboxylesterase